MSANLPTLDTMHNAEKDAFAEPLPDPFVSAWLAELAAQHYAQATLVTYRQALHGLLGFIHAHNLSWQQLSRQQVSDYLMQRIEQDKIGTASVQHELTVLRQLFRWLHAKGVVSANPTTAIRLKRPPRPLPSLVDSDVLSQLLDQPMPEDRDDARLWVRDKAMLELLYGSGLRVSELVGLNMSDIDKAQRLLRITGKGNKTRIVPIGRQAWQALLDYLPHRSLWVEHQDPAVFVSERLGTRLSTRTVQLRIKVQAKRAGIAQDMYPHLLRHCFASHLLSDSGDLRGVQELLGHSDISTTQIYTHLDFGHLSKVYDTAHPRSRRSSS